MSDKIAHAILTQKVIMVEAIGSISFIGCISDVFESKKDIYHRVLLNARADLDETFKMNRKNQDLLFEMRQKKQIFDQQICFLFFENLLPICCQYQIFLNF